MDEDAFRGLLTRERRRAERSGNPFILVLVDARSNKRVADAAISKILPVLRPAIRETDTIGWYSDRCVAGVIFTELGDADPAKSALILRGKIEKAMIEGLGKEIFDNMGVTLHLFPEF